MNVERAGSVDMTSAVVRGDRRLAHAPATGIELLLLPDGIEIPEEIDALETVAARDEIEVLVRAEEDGRRNARLRPLWHRVEPLPGMDLGIWSDREKLRILRISIRSSARNWNPSWVRLSYAVRQVPSDLGGDALAAQDSAAEDGSSITLLLLPGDHRLARLEFDCALNETTYPDDYRFHVVAEDTEDGAEWSIPALLRLRHPDSVLINHLPAIYQPDAGDRNIDGSYEDPPFFVRFLRGFEDAREPLNETAAHLEKYFDPDMAPPDFLPWLSVWVSLVQDANWPELKRRRLVREAVELFRWRGTRRGLSRYLELYAGVRPEINDQPFEGMRLGSETRLGQNAILGDVPPHTFVVTLAVPNANAVNEQIVRDIIESQKPAHTAYELRILQSVDTE